MSWRTLQTEIQNPPSNRDATAALTAAAGAEERMDRNLGLDGRELMEIGRQAVSALGGGSETDSRALRVLAEAVAGLGYESNDEYEAGCLEYALELAQRSGDSVDSLALKAELLMRTGRIKDGSGALRGLPTDHWRVCVATAKLCDATGNLLLKRKALRAAVANAPEARKAMLNNRLANEMIDHGRYEEGDRRAGRGDPAPAGLRLGPPQPRGAAPPARPLRGGAGRSSACAPDRPFRRGREPAAAPAVRCAAAAAEDAGAHPAL